MGWLAKLRFLRGTALDVFGYTVEGGAERQLIRDYEADLRALLPRLDAGNHAAVIELACLPEQIRGYGHVKAANMARAAQRRGELRRQLGLERGEASTLPQSA